MNENKLSAPDHYQAKKEAAKIVAAARGIPYKEAFESIPDELVTSINHQEIADTFLNGQPDDSKKKKNKK